MGLFGFEILVALKNQGRPKFDDIKKFRKVTDAPLICFQCHEKIGLFCKVLFVLLASFR